MSKQTTIDLFSARGGLTLGLKLSRFHVLAAIENDDPAVAAIPKDGGSTSDLSHSRELECHKRTDGFKDIYGRMASDKPSPTTTGRCFNPSKGRILHPHGDRSITLREAALLQTFPVSYRFPVEGNNEAVALMIGNALPPAFTEQHASQISKSLKAAARMSGHAGK